MRVCVEHTWWLMKNDASARDRTAADNGALCERIRNRA